MFARTASRPVDVPVWTSRRQPMRGSRSRIAAVDEPAPSSDPAAQVELVEAALEKLDAVRLLVGRLPEIPLGDRQSLIAQLASTAESLRSLTFLDAIY